MSARQITIKPTCMREVVAFPSDHAALLWEKINYLVTDPLPDGKTKKKLKGGKNIYRLDVRPGRLQRAFGAYDTGEPDDAKVSSPVRRGADGKGLREPDLAGGLPYDSDHNITASSEFGACLTATQAVETGDAAGQAGGTLTGL